MKYLQNLWKALLSGFLIGIGSWVYVLVENHYVGAFLFSLGLITIIVMQWNLYTGKIGFINKHNILDLLWMLLWNLIGITLFALLAYTVPNVKDICTNLVNAKLNKEWYQILIQSFMCGIMIYLAVLLYKRTQNVWLVTLCIMIFILAGFEHCIADTFYFVCAMNTKAFWFIPLCILGNSLGSISFHWIIKLSELEGKKKNTQE